MLRIGHIDYANCTPIFSAMQDLYQDDGYEFVRGVPARLNNMLATGEIDLCPSSSIAFSMMPDRLLIMPDLSISSFGAVQSVMLFSKKPVELLGSAKVSLSAQSATSVNLLKILLKKRYLLDCSYSLAEGCGLDSMGQSEALLLIGDAALKAVQSAPDLHIYDLGELWYGWTGTPFVFALWLVSRAAYLQKPDELKRIADRFVQAKTYAMNNLAKIAESAPERDWMGKERLLEYWKVLSYDLSDQHIQGLKLFFSYAAELELIKSAPQLAFIV